MKEIRSKHSFLEPLSEKHKEQSQILTQKQPKASPPKEEGAHGYKELVLAPEIITPPSLVLDSA